MSQKVGNPEQSVAKYDLISISNHSGGLGSGHYTAKALNNTCGRWCDFNDSMTSETSDLPETLTSQAAYILIYRRADVVVGASAKSSGNNALQVSTRSRQTSSPSRNGGSPSARASSSSSQMEVDG